jgi:hypothetical protein
MLTGKGMDGFDIGIFEPGNFDRSLGAIAKGIVVERAVGGCFCVSALIYLVSSASHD